MDTSEDPGLKPNSGDRRQQQRQLSKQRHFMGEVKGRQKDERAACYWLSIPPVLFLHQQMESGLEERMPRV